MLLLWTLVESFPFLPFLFPLIIIMYYIHDDIMMFNIHYHVAWGVFVRWNASSFTIREYILPRRKFIQEPN